MTFSMSEKQIDRMLGHRYVVICFRDIVNTRRGGITSKGG
jgi:hypothetical protein